MEKTSLPTLDPKLLLRLGLAFCFAYAATSSLLLPNDWIGYMPEFFKNLFPASLLLTGFSLYEIVLTLWLLSGRKTFYAALLSALTLISITLLNLSVFEVTFRDIGLFLASLSLANLVESKS